MGRSKRAFESRVKEVLRGFETQGLLERDNYSVLLNSGEIVNAEQSVDSIIASGEEEVFIFSRKEHLQGLELPQVVEGRLAAKG